MVSQQIWTYVTLHVSKLLHGEKEAQHTYGGNDLLLPPQNLPHAIPTLVDTNINPHMESKWRHTIKMKRVTFTRHAFLVHIEAHIIL